MIEVVDKIVDFVVTYTQSFGFLFGMLVIIMESIVPALPLGVFVAVNMMAFGDVLGFVISWIGTILGCSIAYFICYRFLNKYFLNKSKKYGKLSKVIVAIKNMDMAKLVIIMALPLTPAFLLNIAAGITGMNYKKFLMSTIISKASILIFWGLLGKSILVDLRDWKTIIVSFVLVVLAYVVSKLVSKKYKIE